MLLCKNLLGKQLQVGWLNWYSSHLGVVEVRSLYYNCTCIMHENGSTTKPDRVVDMTLPESDLDPVVVSSSQTINFPEIDY